MNKSISGCGPPEIGGCRADRNQMDTRIGPTLSIQEIPTMIRDHIFSFLDIVDYVCNIMLVCKEWNVENTPDIILDKSILIRQIIYNTCKHKLFYINQPKWKAKYQLTQYDLIYEYELSASYTSIYNQQFPFEDDTSIICISYPTYPLYFTLPINTRKVLSIKYIFNYIYLCKIGESNKQNLFKLFQLLTRLFFSGCTLCSGFLLDLVYYQYVNIVDLNIRRTFDRKLYLLFEYYLCSYVEYMVNKQKWVYFQNFHYLLSTNKRYRRDMLFKYQKHVEKRWLGWIKRKKRYNGMNELYYRLEAIEAMNNA